jgi:tRNA (mo5U34)-methyltransferase
MRLKAPKGFRVSEFYADVSLFQNWDIFPGHRAVGPRPMKNVETSLAMLDVPARLDGKRVLEIGPWNGFFGFECLRRGARELVALGPDDPELTGFNRTADLLQVGDRIRYVRASIYDIKQHDLGTFDVVLFLGVVYHLRHPLLALDLLYDHCRDGAMFLFDGGIMDLVSRATEGPDQEALRPSWDAVQHIPMSMFVRGGPNLPPSLDAYNWFVPNAACMRAWVISSGFEIAHESIDPGGWHFIRAIPVERPFVIGLEGYNPQVQQRVVT